MFEVEFITNLWDLEDEGIDRVLDRLQGEIGVSGISVPAAGGPIMQLRRRKAVDPRIFRSRGGFFFQPDDAKYNTTRCKPTVSGWLKARNPLAKVGDACTRHGLRLSAAVDVCTIGRLATRYPECATKTMFGDVSPGRICVHNPDAAELLRGLVEDLTSNYPLTTVDLAGLDRAFATDLLAPDDSEILGPGHRELMAVCFCESCLQSAGSHADAAINSAQTTIETELQSNHPGDETLCDLLARDDILAHYVTNRREAHGAFTSSLIEAADRAVRMHVSACNIDDAERALAAGTICTCAQLLDDRDASLLQRFRAIHADHAEHRRLVLMPAVEPPSTDATAIVKSVRRVAEAGLSGVQLDHYARMSESDLTAAKQAIRYARRESEL